MISSPPNEAERLHALARYAILDTPPEPAFDRITALAARLLRVPSALVTLVDAERLWFKSCYGFSAPEAGRAEGFCAQTICANTSFVIPDTHADPAYVHNPLVTGEPFIRFYAGVPLVSPDGYALGSLCVLDTTPRALSADEQATLHDLAAMVMDELTVRVVMRAQNAEMAARVHMEAERKATLHALAESEAQLRTIVEHANAMIYIKDRDGRYLLMNKAGADLLNRSVHEIVGHGSDEVVSPEQRAQIRAIDQHVLTTQQPYSYEHPVDQHDDRTLLTTKFPYIGPNGAVLGVVGLGYEITERKRAEAALQESEARFRSAFHASPLGMAIVALHGRCLSVNRALCDMVGYTEEALLGMRIQALLHPDDVVHDRACMKQLLRGEKETCELGTRYVHKNGHALWMAVAASLVRDAAGHARYFILQLQDITERKRAQDHLRDSEARKTAMLETALDCIITVDHYGRIVEFNPAAERTFGYRRDAVLGQDMTALLVPPDLRAAHQRGMDRYLATGVSHVLDQRLELPAYRADGNLFPAELTVTSTVVNGVPFFTAYLRDITERAAAEMGLRQAKAEAEQANRAKSEFLGRMSHELRTPLNAILGFAQLLNLDPLGPQQRTGVEHILQAGQHLLQLINEVLDITRIEAGRMALSFEPVQVDELLAETLDMVRPLAAQQHIALHLPPADVAAPVYILADRQRLKQVLLNLFSNAVKYNQVGGSVTLACTPVGDDRLQIAVHDTGQGIAPAELARLFAPFERLDADRTNVEGTGLGLALSKRLVEAMQGTITVISTSNKGSIFAVELQCAEAPLAWLERSGELLALPAGGGTDASTVVYIDGNVGNLALIERIMQQRPRIRLLPAVQGHTGLDLVREHQPDLVLLDLHLPDMDGLHVLHALQADARTAHIPVLVLSADATDGQIQRLMAAGATAYITKPLDIHQFFHVLDQTLQQKVGS